MGLTADEAARRAARGAAFLDVQCPGWATDVDLGRLDVAHPCHCVLGQLFPAVGFGDAARTLWPEAADEAGIISAYGCGVSTPEDCAMEDRRAAFDLLTEAWRAEIATRTGVVS